MNKEIWKMPVPATALVTDPVFSIVPRRKCNIYIKMEGSNGNVREINLLFNGVESFRCTYMSSLKSDVVNSAYGKIAEIEESSWLEEVKGNSSEFYKTIGQSTHTLKHLAICFDDGPCFEFICIGVDVT